jgi:UDP-N-acetylglucosamine--N-acetylmuramyl-(pentapeptide) pyrophosphoryl-undecaprenol N-acetylglucosamine transferase
MANARVIEDAGGALVFREGDLTGKALKDELLKLMRNRDELKKMSSAMRKLACTDATRKLADEVLELARLSFVPLPLREGN